MINLDFIKEYDIVVFEGFEMTGKSTLINKLAYRYNAIVYKADWDKLLSDNVLKRGNRYIPGLAVVDLVSQASNLNRIVFLDRWVASSYVYKKIYEQESDFSINSLLESYMKCSNKLRILFIHKYHSSIDEAKHIYKISKEDDNHYDVYDKFEGFDDYWERYKNFEKMYDEFYKITGANVIKLSSYMNMNELNKVI